VLKQEYKEKIPEAVVRRLPKYFRYLEELERQGEERISSLRMSQDTGFNASQIRRDLNCFGGFGQQGYGYSVRKLKSEIAHILGPDKQYRSVIIGAGNMGQALVRYTPFKTEGFNILALFDVNPALVGKSVGGCRILPMDELEEFLKKNDVQIGVICTPSTVAQATADMLVSLGVIGIWNFAPADVVVRPGVAIENIHLSDSLHVLFYRTVEEQLLHPPGGKNDKKMF